MGWPKSEVDRYHDDRIRELGPMYAAHGISIHEPEKRAEYLMRILKLGMTDEDLINRTTCNAGEAKALLMLEEMAVNEFF